MHTTNKEKNIGRKNMHPVLQISPVAYAMLPEEMKPARARKYPEKLDEDDARSRARGLWNGCFSRPQETRRWNKSKASLLGASCPPSKEIRDTLFPDHPAMPLGCPIKAKFAVRAHFTGHRGIYHMEGCRSYGRTEAPDRWFCSEDEAKAEGFRKAFGC